MKVFKGIVEAFDSPPQEEESSEFSQESDLENDNEGTDNDDGPGNDLGVIDEEGDLPDFFSLLP
jgi:hypothetical protein